MTPTDGEAAVDEQGMRAPVDVLGRRTAAVALVLLAAVSLFVSDGTSRGVAAALDFRSGLSFLWTWRLPSLVLAALLYLVCDGATSWRRPAPGSAPLVRVIAGTWLVLAAFWAFGLQVDTLDHAGVRGVVASVLIVPLVEELVFRGAVFRLAERVWPYRGGADLLWPPILVSSLLFALGHLQYWNFDVPAAFSARWYTFFLGLGLGVARFRSRSIWPPIAIHMAVNLVIVAGALRL